MRLHTHGHAHVMPGRPAQDCISRQATRHRLPCRQHRARCKHQARAGQPAVQQTSYEPAWLPAPASEVEEPACRQALQNMQQAPVAVSGFRRPLQTTFLGPSGYPGGADASGRLPVLLVPSFDSSILEYRRLLPLLSASLDTWAVDVVGWGFTDAGFATDPSTVLGPQQKREHLYAFWKAKIGRPVAVAGVSLGGAVALDFAVAHPEAVAKLVLVDAQAFTDGLGTLCSLPQWLLLLSIQVLKAKWLRRYANTQAYHDVKRYATEDAMRIGRLHTFMPGWADANAAFIRSGGYSLSKQVARVQQPTLVVWGAQDKILPPSDAQRFAQAIPHAQVEMLQDCGHSPHLEQPAALAQLISDFVAA